MSKTYERSIMFARSGWYSGLVKVFSATNHVLDPSRRLRWEIRGQTCEFPFFRSKKPLLGKREFTRLTPNFPTTRITPQSTAYHFGIINALIAMRHRFLLAASFLYLVGANLIWIARDTRPPFWDMAEHQSSALRIYDAFASQGIRGIAEVPRLTLPYPPFYQSVVAGFYAIFGKSVDAAQWANLVAMAILLFATYGLGRTLLKPVPAAAAAVLVNFYPYLLWLSRETLTDYWLTSMVALAMWSLMLTNDFSDRKRSIIFGVVCGLGMLTKWTFALFLLLPTLWAARKNIKNAAISAGTAAVLAGYWYIHALAALAQLLRINTAGAVNEGDPDRLSFQAVLFYVRALEGSQLFLPLFLAFIAGAILLARNFDRAWMPVVLWIAGGWLGLMLFQNKDPRQQRRSFFNGRKYWSRCSCRSCCFSTTWSLSAFRYCRRQ